MVAEVDASLAFVVAVDAELAAFVADVAAADALVDAALAELAAAVALLKQRLPIIENDLCLLNYLQQLNLLHKYKHYLVQQ